MRLNVPCDITPECLERDYHGPGKVWIAVKDERVVALRYMSEVPPLELPAWVEAVRRHADGVDALKLPDAWKQESRLALADAAMKCADLPRRSNGKHYFPGEILAMARAVIVALEQTAFNLWRDKCRAELGSLGEVGAAEFRDDKLVDFRR